jgi:tetratricopeptide (TPR) repeat protein
MIYKYSNISIFLFFMISCSASQEDLIKAAKTKLDEESYNKAIEYLDQAISSENNNAETYNMRGVAYFSLAAYQEAIQDFSSAILIDSINYKPYYNRGNSHLNLKEFAKALIDYNLAIAYLPNNADLYINRAIVLFELKQFKMAITDYEFAIKLAPNNYLAFLNKAKTHIQIGEFTVAEEILSHTLKLNSQGAEPYYWLGFIHLNTGREISGCDYLTKAKNRGFKDADEAIEKFCNQNS